MSGVLVYVGWAAVAAGLVAIVVPNVLAFSWSIEAGLKFIDAFYPWPQNHSAFLRRPLQIRAHAALTECRFGFTQALRAWPENEAAARGLAACLGRMIEDEIAQRASLIEINPRRRK